MTTMTYEILSLVEREERPGDEREWFVIDPHVVYPATVAHIQDVLASGKFPNELTDPNSREEIDMRSAGRLLLQEARMLPGNAWVLALKPRDELTWSKPGDNGSFQSPEVGLRAAALDLARRWFTQALHVSAGGDGTPIGVHLIKDERYRL